MTRGTNIPEETFVLERTCDLSGTFLDPTGKPCAEKPLEIFECPARLDATLQQEIASVCLDAYHVLGCRDWSRIDVRLDAAGRPHIIEINPLPGILPKPEDNSCFPKAARAAGMSYNQLINAVLDIALERCGLLAEAPGRESRATA